MTSETIRLLIVDADPSVGEDALRSQLAQVPGFATIMRLYPQENLGILIMANGTQLNSVQLVELLSSLPRE